VHRDERQAAVHKADARDIRSGRIVKSMLNDGWSGDFLKVLWHDGLGLSLYAKRLECGRFVWPSPADGVVSISAAQLGYLLEGIDWRHPQRTWRPAASG
jgi:transposase